MNNSGSLQETKPRSRVFIDHKTAWAVQGLAIRPRKRISITCGKHNKKLRGKRPSYRQALALSMHKCTNINF